MRVIRWKLKSCPRCGGDLFIENDIDRNWYEQCLQCAYWHQIDNIEELREHHTHDDKKTPLAGGARS